MKYIILEDLKGHKTPILFPATLQHKDVAAKFPELKVTSAGFFFDLYTCEGKAFGRSESLNVGSKDSDLALIQRNFRS